MSNNPIEWLKENKCSECFRYTARGYTLCEGHLYGFSRMMDEEDIERLKKYKESQSRENE